MSEDLVKKAALAIAEFNYCGHCHGSCESCTGEARAALAAVWPLIARRVLEEAADAMYWETDIPLRGVREPRRWLRARAARLATTTEETTT